MQHPLRTRLVRSLSCLAAIGVGLLALATLGGCGGGAKTAQITLFPEYVLTDPAGKIQAKSAVPVKLSRVQMTWDGEKEKRWKRAGAAS